MYRNNSLLLAAFFALSGAAFPQQPPGQLASAPEMNIRPGMEATGYCRLPRNLMMGRNDKFAPNGAEMPPPASPALTQFIASKNMQARMKGFDDPAQDKWLAGSWQIPGCRVCRDSVLVVGLRRPGIGLSSNDALHIGRAPFDNANQLAYAKPWQVSNTDTTDNGMLTRTLSIPLSAAQLNQFILSAPLGPVWLDFLIQDDTEVDFVQLSIVQ
jgi:hypothetical protein